MELTKNVAYNARVYDLSMLLAKQDYESRSASGWLFNELSVFEQNHLSEKFREHAKVALEYTAAQLTHELYMWHISTTSLRNFMVEQGYYPE